MNVRALAAKCCYSVIDKGRSLSDELPEKQEKLIGKDKGLLQEICYGVLRYLPELENDVRLLVAKPLTGKQRVFHFLMLVGVYQIKYMRTPDHAAVSETVAATAQLKNRHMKGLINGVLRNFQRQNEQDSTDVKPAADAIRFNHPSWFIKKLQQGYPENWQTILHANQEKPPMWLRVNQQQGSSSDYQQLLAEENIAIDTVESNSQAIALTKAVDVNSLPNFVQGAVSVQDAAAQQAAILLDCQAGDHVLDCCAAPGGKTCHILETTPHLASMTAIDIEESRLVRVHENLARLNLSAKIITGDAAKPEQWWDEQLFDRILLDAPCSGTGVIRRHPDIKWLRKAQDIDELIKIQADILKKTWSLLKPGGTLLYATCSVLPEENVDQVKHFLANNGNATLVQITENSADIGWQILPQPASIQNSSMDGFFYAKITKQE